MTDPVSLLRTYKRDLERVIREDAFVCTTNMARNWLSAVNAALARPIDDGPYGTAGTWGVNGLGPLIEGIIREAEIHKRLNEGVAVSSHRRSAALRAEPQASPAKPAAANAREMA